MSGGHVFPGEYAQVYVKNFALAETALQRDSRVGRIVSLDEEGLNSPQKQALYTVGNVLSQALKFYAPGENVEYCLIDSDEAAPFITLIAEKHALIVVPLRFIRILNVVSALAASTDVFTHRINALYEATITGENYKILSRDEETVSTPTLDVIPKCEEYTAAMSCLFTCMMGVILFHELCHFLHGHLYLQVKLSLSRDSCDISSIWSDERERRLSIETMEFDADSFAAIAWKHLILGNMPIPNNLRLFFDSIESPDWMIMYSAALAFTMEDINNMPDSTWVNETVTHRHARARITVILQTYAAFLKERLGWSEENVECLASAVAGDIATTALFMFNSELPPNHHNNVKEDLKSFDEYSENVLARWALIHPALVNLAPRIKGKIPAPTRLPR